jgi:hypothetical protein
MANEDTLSTQSIRMMRASIKNSSQYSDDELTKASIILGNLYAAMTDVPTFLPVKDQISFFTNIVACFMLGSFVNSGFIDPHAASQCISEIEQMGSGSSQQDDGDDEIAVITGKSGSVN